MNNYKYKYKDYIFSIETNEKSIFKIKLNTDKKIEYSDDIPNIISKLFLQLDEYFSGNRTNFDIKYTLIGTDFQKLVWKELNNIPYGETISYSELAKRIGKPKAVRAVGGALNKNPIPIIVPCHRVIGKNGNLTGFAGGLDLKTHLLNIEKSQPL